MQQGGTGIRGDGLRISDSGFALDSPQEAFRVLFSANTYTSSGYLLHEHGDALTDYFHSNMEYASCMHAADYAKAIGELEIVKSRFATSTSRIATCCCLPR